MTKKEKIRHMAELAKNPECAYRLIAAENPYTSKETLASLADDPEWMVRMFVAGHHDTPTNILERLAKDGDADVRSWVAWNPKTPKKVLEKLAKDEYKFIREAAKRHWPKGGQNDTGRTRSPGSMGRR